MEKILEKEQVKKGYKKSVMGLIPNNWNLIKLGDLGTTFSGISGKSKEDFGFGQPYIPYKNIFFNSKVDVNFLDYVNIGNSESQNEVQYGDIFFTVSSESAKEVGMSSVLLNEINGLYLNSFCFGFRLKDFNILDPFFASYLLRGEKIRQKIIELAQGSTRFNLSKSGILKLSIITPPLPEQQKIASILSIWDEAITATKSLIVQTKKRNQGLAQQLLTGKTRLKGFERKWMFEKISSVTDRIKNSFIPEKEAFYQQIGIRSHGKGIFYKELVTGESLGNKSVFWIEPNCFIVNIVFAWEQAVAKTTENEVGMIASHRFPMFRPKSGILYLDYLLYFFKSPKGKDLLSLASPGGAGRNKTLGQSDFLKLQIPVPEFNEQKAISKVLETANQELKTLEQKLKTLQEQKKGLMQKLLTGQIRVKK